jgi:UDP-N-acetylglucosamine 2-epimerase (non-hydrolysing)
VLGTRPEIIRLSRLIPKLDALCEHVLVHTGQNFDPSLSDVFFRDLGVRAPDVSLGVRADSFGEQAGQILAGTERALGEHAPDRLLILGDTNSGLAAVVAKRMGVPVYHMEAGNRCFDDRVPEEVNRRIIDHSSDVLLPYTERSRANLLREGIASQRVIVTGNPILEVLEHYKPCVDASDVHARIGVERGAYFLVTAHRAENVDVPERLRQLAEALRRVGEEHRLPIVISMHPRGAARPAAVRPVRFRGARAGRCLRADGQRYRPGGVLHPPRRERDHARCHGTSRNGGMRQQHHCRRRSRPCRARRARGTEA